MNASQRGRLKKKLARATDLVETFRLQATALPDTRELVTVIFAEFGGIAAFGKELVKVYHDDSTTAQAKHGIFKLITDLTRRAVEEESGPDLDTLPDDELIALIAKYGSDGPKAGELNGLKQELHEARLRIKELEVSLAKCRVVPGE